MTFLKLNDLDESIIAIDKIIYCDKVKKTSLSMDNFHSFDITFVWERSLRLNYNNKEDLEKDYERIFNVGNIND